ncbi:MAG: phosphonatase-like hydrolase [Flavisolibacter sp.]
MPLKLAVFDIAGTTLRDNNYVAKAFQKAFSQSDLDVSFEDINPLMGYHKPSAIEMVLQRKNESFDQERIKKIHFDFVNEMIDFYQYSPDLSSLPHAEETFLFLQQKGVIVALNTGFSKDIANIIVERMQWIEKGLVDDYIASDEVEAGRPFPFMIDALKKRNGISSNDEVMKCGDTTVDIQEGKNAGCTYNIAVTTGAAKKEDLELFGPTHIISSLSEIPGLLKKSFQVHA